METRLNLKELKKEEIINVFNEILKWAQDCIDSNDSNQRYIYGPSTKEIGSVITILTRLISELNNLNESNFLLFLNMEANQNLLDTSLAATNMLLDLKNKDIDKI